jgi:hypothetical protein
MPSFLQAPSTPGIGAIAQPPPPAPQAPQTPNPDIAPVLTGPTLWRVPRTAAEQAILQAQREALSSQIINVRDRRNSIARSYERASGANRSGLEQQLRVLDDRLLQLEQDLAESGRALYQSNVTTTSSLGVMPRQFFNMSSGQMTGISIVFILFVLGPLSASLGRLMWRRSTKPTMPPGWYDAAHRLERLEQAVDTIAVEVERVSEGQRFMTKIMTQNAAAATSANGAPAAGVNGAQPLALGPGAPPDPIVQNQRDEVRIRRS